MTVLRNGQVVRWTRDLKKLAENDLNIEPRAAGHSGAGLYIVGLPAGCLPPPIVSSELFLLNTELRSLRRIGLPVERAAYVIGDQRLAIVPRWRSGIHEAQVWLLRKEPVPILLHVFGGRDAGLDIKQIVATDGATLILASAVGTIRALSDNGIEQRADTPYRLILYNAFADVVVRDVEIQPRGRAEVAMSPLGLYFAIINGDSLEIRDHNLDVVRSATLPESARVTSFAISDDGRYVVLGGDRLRAWDSLRSEFVLLSSDYRDAIVSEVQLSETGDPAVEHAIRSELLLTVECFPGDMNPKAISYTSHGDVSIWDLDARKLVKRGMIARVVEIEQALARFRAGQRGK